MKVLDTVLSLEVCITKGSHDDDAVDRVVAQPLEIDGAFLRTEKDVVDDVVSWLENKLADSCFLRSILYLKALLTDAKIFLDRDTFGLT